MNGIQEVVGSIPIISTIGGSDYSEPSFFWFLVSLLFSSFAEANPRGIGGQRIVPVLFGDVNTEINQNKETNEV